MVFHNCFYAITYFIWLDDLSVGIVDISFKALELANIPHPLLLHTFSVKLQTFPTEKLKKVGFLLDQTQQYTPVLFAKTLCELILEKELLSGHFVTYLGDSWHMLHYMVHMTPLCIF